ncbi:MAG: hypothetical protein Q9167_007775 [Letrouitia subvulpina]
MTSAAQNNGKSFGPNANLQPSREDLNRRLVGKSFDRILDILQQLSLYEKSPKLFVIYAHDNEKSGFKAHQEIVKKYISWFKRIRFNVDSDKSPHGYGVAHEVGHLGASSDIFMNQVCLLPRSWHEQNVDYVLVFYSKVLASYMKYERNFNYENKTYSNAVTEICQKLEKNFRNHTQDEWDKALGEIRDVQKRYSNAMDKSFHHVMTETALLSFTNGCGAVDKTIPIILFGDENWEPDLQWQPQFIHNADTRITITIEPEEEYRQFFKILLEFETLERDRPLIEVLIECFEDSVKLSKEDLQPETYSTQVEVLITKAMQSLNHQWHKIERPITRGDIRRRLDLYSKLDGVRRISGERLLGNLNDIDLAVTRDLFSGDEELEETRQIVPLHSLFDEKKVSNGNIRPQRIVIQGRPGIGKTTLCRRLMYEYSWQENLRTKFHLVVRIPVRNLEYSADLSNLLFEEYFQDASKGRDLSMELQNLILSHKYVNSEDKAANSVKVLIILDGLDEAVSWSQGKHHLLEELMKGNAVIITSRFLDTKMPHVSADLHLEALGFSNTSVEAYLDNTANIPNDKALEIHKFINSNPFVKDMVRVPIHLDILCYSWDELHRQNTVTITAVGEGENILPRLATLYQAIVHSLWRKDIPSLDKLDHGKEVTAEIVDAVKDATRLDRLVRTENCLLEEIAIDMIESKRLGFTDKDVAEVIRRWESNGDLIPLSLERELHKFSLLRSYSTDRHREFSFIHLTFQDFFAARYIVRSRVQDPSRLKTLLRRYKYDRQYENFWRFTAGLQSKNKDLEYFFNLLDREPRDLMGTQHIRLIMYCLNECRAQLQKSRVDELQARLEDWHQLELRVCNNRGIGSSIEFPEKILCKQLKMSEQLENSSLKCLLRTICNRTWLSERFIRFFTQWVYDHGKHPLNIHIVQKSLSPTFIDAMAKDLSTIWILRHGPKLPESTIHYLIEQIPEYRKHQEFSNMAKLVLQDQHRLPNSAIQKLDEWLRSDDLYFCRTASSILGKQETLPKEIFDHAVENLIAKSKKNKDGNKFHQARDAYGSSWVFESHDLHPKAVAILLSRFETLPEYVLEKMVRPLQTDNLRIVANLLEKCLHPDSAWNPHFNGFSDTVDPPATDIFRNPAKVLPFKIFAVTIFEEQPSLPTNILKSVVQLLDEEDGTVRATAQRVLQKQPELYDDVITKLRDLFNNGRFETRKLAVILALKGRLQLLHEAFRWIFEETFRYLNPQIVPHRDAAIDLSKALECLDGESDLPYYFVNALVYYLPNLFRERKTSFEKVAHLVGQQRELSDDVVRRLIESFKSYDHFSFEQHGTPALFNRPVFTAPLIDALEIAKTEEQAEGFVSGLMLQENIDQKSLESLRRLVMNSNVAPFISQQASRIFLRSPELDLKTISAIHEGLTQRQGSFWPLWRDRHMEQFFANLESFEPCIIDKILRIMLKRTPEILTSGYIDDKTLHFDTADGNLGELNLADEKTFRKSFREAQSITKIPEWALVNLRKTVYRSQNQRRIQNTPFIKISIIHSTEGIEATLVKHLGMYESHAIL